MPVRGRGVAVAGTDDGLDAPPVFRNLILTWALGLTAWSLAALHVWSGAVRLPGGDVGLVLVLVPAGLSVGIASLAMATWPPTRRPRFAPTPWRRGWRTASPWKPADIRRLPGGVALLSDIRHLDDYRRAFARAGWSAAVEGSVAARVLLAMVTFGSLRPGVVRAVRPI